MDGKVNVKEKIRLKYKIITKSSNIGLHGMPTEKNIIARKQNKRTAGGRKMKGY